MAALSSCSAPSTYRPSLTAVTARRASRVPAARSERAAVNATAATATAAPAPIATRTATHASARRTRRGRAAAPATASTPQVPMPTIADRPWKTSRSERMAAFTISAAAVECSTLYANHGERRCCTRHASRGVAAAAAAATTPSTTGTGPAPNATTTPAPATSGIHVVRAAAQIANAATTNTSTTS